MGFSAPILDKPASRDGASHRTASSQLATKAVAPQLRPSRIPLQRKCAACEDEKKLQTKLAISEPGDALEQEADRVADRVMRMSAPVAPMAPKIMRREIGTAPDGTPASVHDTLRAEGRPLDAKTRAFMEPRLGADFGVVRVHEDADAARSARDVRALAYTAGTNIVFGAGQYRPSSPEGRRLLAHELAHVIQQNGASPVRRLARTDDPDPGTPTQNAPPAAQPVFFCSKPVAAGFSHAFFRVGGAGPGNPTYELEHDEYGDHCPCGIQGWPTRDYPEDRDAAEAPCTPVPAISAACLASNWNTYPIGKYCALGPNSNTYARVLAESCGGRGLRPPGRIPGFDDPPPTAGTANPAMDARFTFLPGFCGTIQCDDDTCKRVYF